MKTERRHALESNTLAKELNVWSDKLRPYSSAVLMGIAAVLGLYAVLSMWNSHAASREDAAWYQYETALLAGDPDFKSVRRAAVSDDLQGSKMQEWAYVAWADRQLVRAANEYLINRESSKDRVSGAEKVYLEISANGANPEVRSRAQLGLARVRELQNRLDDARKEYARVEGALQSVAAARLKEIEGNEKQMTEVATWLATADLPAPAAPSGAGMPGTRPDFGAEPPAADGQGAGDPFNPSQTLEEILGGKDQPEEGRYEDAGDAAKGADAPAAEDAAAEGAGEGDAVAPSSDAPAGASDETAPAAGTSSDAAPATPAATTETPAAEGDATDGKAAEGTAPAGS